MRIDSIINMINNREKSGREVLKYRDQKSLVSFGIKSCRGLERRIDFYMMDDKPYEVTYTNTLAKQRSKSEYIEDFNVIEMMKLWDLCNDVSKDAENIRRD